MKYANTNLSWAAITITTLAMASFATTPQAPAGLAAVAPFISMGALIYAAAHILGNVIANITVQLAESIATAVIVLDQAVPKDPSASEICVELEEATEALNTRQRLRAPGPLPTHEMLATTGKDWGV